VLVCAIRAAWPKHTPSPKALKNSKLPVLTGWPNFCAMPEHGMSDTNFCVRISALVMPSACTSRQRITPGGTCQRL